MNIFSPAEDDFLGDSGSIFDSTHIGNTDNDDGALEESTRAGGDPFGQNVDLNVDELLADTSVMFPILGEESVGDVNDLFGELELLLAVSAFFVSLFCFLNWPLVLRSMCPPCLLLDTETHRHIHTHTQTRSHNRAHTHIYSLCIDIHLFWNGNGNY